MNKLTEKLLIQSCLKVILLLGVYTTIQQAYTSPFGNEVNKVVNFIFEIPIDQLAHFCNDGKVFEISVLNKTKLTYHGCIEPIYKLQNLAPCGSSHLLEGN